MFALGLTGLAMAPLVLPGPCTSYLTTGMVLSL
jgi:hypothetical protein